jgi:hypothetical protein
MHKFLPDLSHFSPRETTVMWWKCSQVTPGTNAGNSTQAALPITNAGAPLVLAGDSIAGSNYENCLRSALHGSLCIQKMLGVGDASL